MEKNKKDKDSRQFWEYVERTSARVDKWPDWKRGDISNLPSTRVANSSNGRLSQQTHIKKAAK
ncbi:MAG: hypothetical protein ABH871_05940 [Pseudomonadota bacterium]